MTKIALIVVVVFAIFLAGAAFSERLMFVGDNPKTLTKSITPKSEKSQAGNPSGWQTYESKDYGFSFSYPRDFQVGKNPEERGMDGFLISGPGNEDLSLYIYKTACLDKCFQNEIVEWWPKLKIDGKDININGIKGYEINLYGDGENSGQIVREIYLTKNGLVVYFEIQHLPAASANISESQQKIINSFKIE